MIILTNVKGVSIVQFHIFNNTKTVFLEDDIVRKYEANVAPMDFHCAEYLIITSEVKESDSEEVLNMALKNGALEEIQVNAEIGEFFARLEREGRLEEFLEQGMHNKGE